MAARSKARKRAVDVLYAADLRSRDPREQLAEEVAAGLVLFARRDLH